MNKMISTVEAAFRVAASLADTRADVAHANLAVSQANTSVQTLRAVCEQALIEAAGGEKALGGNEEARKRALTIGLHNDPSFRAEQEYAEECELDLRMLQVEREALADQLSILLAALGAGQAELPVAWLYLGLPVEVEAVTPEA